MVAISPFKAIRYNPLAVGDLSRVISPPYDVIDPKEQDGLYASSPYNIVRLILGKENPSDSAADNRYTRARKAFDEWRNSDILRLDDAPAIYLLEHAFGEAKHRSSRLGFIALLELGDDARSQVYRHEQTLSKPKEDRSRLLEALPANLEPIFCVYPDKDSGVQSILQDIAASNHPLIEASKNGETIRAWAITKQNAIKEISSQLTSVSILIADGHHRFEVAYANRHRYPSMMCYFVSMQDPALIVHPIHRVVREKALSFEKLSALCVMEKETSGLSSLMGWLQKSASRSVSFGGSDRADLTKLPQGENSAGNFGYFEGRSLYRLRLKADRLARWLMAPTVHLALATLDVSILHGVIFSDLGLAENDIKYVADAGSAMACVGQADMNSAWLLPPIPLAQVYALAAQGLTLAPKSTYFYPKVPSGLTMHLLSETA